MAGVGLGVGTWVYAARRDRGASLFCAGSASFAPLVASRWITQGVSSTALRDGGGSAVWADLSSSGSGTLAFRAASVLSSAGLGACATVARPFAAITSPAASSSHSAQDDVTITVSGQCAAATSVEVFASVDGAGYTSWGTDSTVSSGAFSVVRVISAGDAGDTPPGSVTLRATATGDGGTYDSSTVAITVTDDLGDTELEGWSGLKAWIDPKDIASLTKVADPAITNGGFASDADWTKGGGWTIGSGIASHAATGTSAITQAKCTVGDRYTLMFTCLSAGGTGVAGQIGSGSVGSYSTDTGTRTYEATCTTSTAIGVSAWTDCTGTIDDVSSVCHSISAIAPRAGSLTSAFAQSTATKQPWIDTTTGAIRFDGSADILDYSGTVGDFKFLHYHATEANNLPLFTVMCVARSAVATTDNIFASYNTPTPGIQLYVLATGQVDFKVYNATGAIASVSSSAGAVAANTPFVHEGWSEGGGASLNQWINGAAAGAADTSWGAPSSSDPIALSLGSSYSTSRLDGTIGDVVIFDRVLSSDERLRLRVKLAKKWGVTLP